MVNYLYDPDAHRARATRPSPPRRRHRRAPAVRRSWRAGASHGPTRAPPRTRREDTPMAPTTYPPALRRRRPRRPDKALFEPPGRTRRSPTRDSTARTGAFRRAPRRRGVAPGDRVAVQVEKSPRGHRALPRDRSRSGRSSCRSTPPTPPPRSPISSATPSPRLLRLRTRHALADARPLAPRPACRRARPSAPTATAPRWTPAAGQPDELDRRRARPTTSPRSSTPPAPPAAPRARCSPTATSCRTAAALLRCLALHRRRRADPRPADLPRPRAVRRANMPLIGRRDR